MSIYSTELNIEWERMSQVCTSAAYSILLWYKKFQFDRYVDIVRMLFFIICFFLTIHTSSKIYRRKQTHSLLVIVSGYIVDSDMNRKKQIRIEYESLFDRLMPPNTTPFILSTHLMDNWRARASNNVFRLLHTYIYMHWKKKTTFTINILNEMWLFYSTIDSYSCFEYDQIASNLIYIFVSS
jgi:hypothetical protein